MSKSKNPIIPVTKTGKVTSHLISVDTMISAAPIKKSTSQTDNPNGKNSIHISPPVSSEIVARFFEQNPYHFRAIMFKALCVAGIGYDIVPVDSKNGNYFEDVEYKKLKDFLDNPNHEGEVFEDILTNWLAERYNYGNGYLEIVSTLKGELAEIYNLRAYNCFPKLYYNNLFYIQLNPGVNDTWFKPLHAVYDPPADKRKKQTSEVVVLKNYHLKTKYFGFPEWYSSTGDLVLDRSIIECRIREFDNNLMIQFMIICEGGEIDNDGITMVKNFLAKNYKGSENAGKVLYLNSDNPDVKIRIERLDKEVREANYLQTREQNRDFIVAAHGVPSILLGAKTKGQLGGTTEIKDMFKIFNETIVKPDKRTTEKKINNLFKTKLGITKFKLELKELTIDTLKEMVEYVSKMKQADIIDKNEARQEFGYEAIEETPQDINAQVNDLNKQLKELRKKLVA